MAVIWEQVDKTVKPTETILAYSWMLDGVKKKYAAKMVGWKWVHGKPGVFVTESAAVASETAAKYGLAIKSNGTHGVHGEAMMLAA